MMTANGILSYTDCCKKLEKIALRRKIYGSESRYKLHKNTSTKHNESKDNVVKIAKNVFEKIPFVCGSSASKSHHIGANIQTALSMVKQFRERMDDNIMLTMSRYYETESEFLFKKNNKGSCGSEEYSDCSSYCPALSENWKEYQEEDTFEGTTRDPWSVRQSDGYDNNIVCSHEKISCNCSARPMESYQKVMAPYVKKFIQKQKLHVDQNPFIKEKTVQHYELLSKRVQELKQTMIATNIELLEQTKRYSKLYEQYTRQQDVNIASQLLEVEDKINDLIAQVEQAVDMYKEGTALLAIQKSNDETSSTYLLALANADNETKPKETNAVRLSKLLKRIQFFQEKLKTGYYCKNFSEIVE
ncbi:uncharacterized protein LOC126897783 [Daktulosphaira vitifoliae]|uniref:uncharacterized protein LOC126897783 n=1 Tax=Daktulosphaira vitifoliae TaxID=58002 RepID=UPI0021AA10B2|nr:uncharacterized protein LOC126897783 [Daktulosphaira vitifoliae]